MILTIHDGKLQNKIMRDAKLKKIWIKKTLEYSIKNLRQHINNSACRFFQVLPIVMSQTNTRFH